jgi:hypothetical protein
MQLAVLGVCQDRQLKSAASWEKEDGGLGVAV